MITTAKLMETVPVIGWFADKIKKKFNFEKKKCSIETKMGSKE